MPFIAWLLISTTLVFAFQARATEVFDYCVEPTEKDDFLEAAFRCILPEGLNHPEAFLVIVHGTDSDARISAGSPAVLKVARDCRAAVIGVYFRGEGLDYDVADRGSGKALEEAATYFAGKLHEPALKDTPFLILGHSAGAQFAFNFTAWRPKRVRAMAVIKAGGFTFKPEVSSYLVPCLIVVGEHDEAGRVRSGTTAFAEAEGKENSKWCFLREKSSGHEVGKSGDLGLLFLKEICTAKAGEARFGNPETGEFLGSNRRPLGPTCWFPSPMFARLWKEIHLPERLKNLANSQDRGGLQDIVRLQGTPVRLSCRNGESISQTIRLDLKEDARATITGGVVESPPFYVEKETVSGTLPLEFPVFFKPQDLPWGPVNRNLIIYGSRDGAEVRPLVVRLSGMVEGPVKAYPALVYLGSVTQSNKVSQKVQLRSKASAIEIIGIRIRPESELSVNIEQSGENVVQLHVRWTPSKRLGMLEGEILIDFNAPEKGSLRIPMVGWSGRQ